MSRRFAILGVLVLAVGLRFPGLGHWSFSGDELATTREAQTLFGRVPADPASQIARLPRLLPASYLIHDLGYRAFGTDELGSRLPAAIAGSLLPALAVGLLWRALGGRAALVVGLLLAVDPELVLQSQQNRFYMFAGLVAGACIAGAAYAIAARHLGAFCAACGVAVLAPLFHPILAAMSLGLFAATWVGMPGGPDGARRRALFAAGATVAVVVVLVAAYHLPLMRHWNAGAGWGYSTGRAVLGGVKRLGVPTLLFGVIGAVLMARTDRAKLLFWAVWVGGWAATLVVLPSVLEYHPAYSFPFMLGPVVLAGYAIGMVAGLLREHAGPTVATIWVAAACLLNAPTLISHYADGSRYDHRSAAAYVAEHRRPGEAVAAVSPKNLQQYQESLADAVAIDGATLARELANVGRQGRPTWLVVPAGRLGRDPEAQAWLNRWCRLERTIRRPRLDYDEYVLDIYRFDPPAAN